uniref:Phosphoribosylaminoimidazole carboxylase n=1 Tax=Magnusiomyces magnusii TaxID=43963 RepID=Q8X117_MAGMU|nr:phosphoribosylaminoimidazole carboxylase [Magnusiomyces magnusii]
MDSRTVGILGGGQLGRMLVEAANRLNITTAILDAENSPATQINSVGPHVSGSFKDAVSIAKFAEKCDVLTVEIEHVNADILQDLLDQKKVKEIHPSPATIKLIQDKYTQKLHYLKHKLPTPAVLDVPNATQESVAAVGQKFGYPFVLKARTNAYDGRGNYVVKTAEDIPEALKALKDTPLYAEKFARFDRELAVMVIRTKDGQTISYPAVETVQENNVCHTVYAPARLSDSIQQQARNVAENAVKTLDGAGIYGVEMFLMNGDNEETNSDLILLNEIAPRPHNSGHYTQDGCAVSQFDAHIRAVLGLPIPPLTMSTPSTYTIMLNILGAKEANGELEVCKRALEVPGCTIHLYGKTTRPGRKMGHINITAGSMREAEAKLAAISGATSKNTIEQTIPKEVAIAGTSSTPTVGIIMGSDSDLPVMSAACKVLTEFNVPYEVKIVSAHRTPSRMYSYAINGVNRGLRVIIAGAGGAAHLPGMVAALTPLPVIGVPVKGSTLDGVDSLHSIVQMPRGVPVATVAINNAMNAGLLAVRILATGSETKDAVLLAKLEKYIQNMENEVLAKTEKLETIGYEKYLEEKKN